MNPHHPAAATPHAEAVAAPDAVALLTADHREVDALFRQYEALVARGAGSAEKRALAEALCVLLTVNTTAKEELFYPAAGGAVEAREALHEAHAEHHRARHLIADIMDMSPADARFDATVKLLGEQAGHRARQEEGGLFGPLSRSGLDLRALGGRLAERKRELMAEMDEVEA
jgi:hypothetical protein